MKRILVALLMVLVFSAPAAAPKRGKERLRELTVFPTLTAHFGLDVQLSDPSLLEPTDPAPPAERLVTLRREVKQNPNDVQRRLLLGECLDEAGDTNAAQACFIQAEKLAREKTELRPKDGLALTDLGDALDAIHKGDEALSAYRRAVLLSSNEWKCWIALGSALDGSSCLRTNLILLAAAPTAEQFHKILDAPPSPSALQETERLQIEAGQCFDRAVQLAHDEPAVYLKRAGHLCLADMLHALIRHFRGEQKIQTGLNPFSKNALPDLRQAVKLKPKACKLYGVIASVELACFIEHGEFVIRETPLKALPDAVQEPIRDAMNHLEDLGLDPDKKLAARSLETLVNVKLLFGGNDLTIKTDLRRALALDPSREPCWDLLTGLIATTASPAELVKVCEERLKARDSARGHLSLAKALVKESRFGPAAKQAELALKDEQEQLNAHLMLGALIIRQSTNADSLLSVTNHFGSATKIIEAMPDDEKKLEKQRELLLNLAIVMALSDENVEAKEWLDILLKRDPEDETAKEIRNAME